MLEYTVLRGWIKSVCLMDVSVILRNANSVVFVQVLPKRRVSSFACEVRLSKLGKIVCT